MGLVVILAGAAVIVLFAYRSTIGGRNGAEVISGLRRQAAVLTTLSMGVFLLLEALEKGKVVASALTAVAGGVLGGSVPNVPGFGRGHPGMAALTPGST